MDERRKPTAKTIAAIALLVLSAMGCGPSLDPAPSDIDGLAHWHWSQFFSAEPTQVLEAALNLSAAVKADSREPPLTGTLSDLTKESLAVTEIDDERDPAEAQGFFLVSDLACDIGRMEEIAIATEQDELRPDFYDSYERTYLTDVDAYLRREVDVLRWETRSALTPITAQYRSTLRSAARFIPEGTTPDGETFGPVLLVLSWLTEPAEFDDPNSSFEQDYQIEVFFEDEPGHMLHLYGIWREMSIGFTSSEDDLFLETTLSGFIDWDRRTEELCAGEGS